MDRPIDVVTCSICGQMVCIVASHDHRFRYCIHAKDGKHCEKSLELVPVVIDEFAGAPDATT